MSVENAARQFERTVAADRRTPAWMMANSSPPSRASTSVCAASLSAAARPALSSIVSGGVTERIVDVLEAVEVEHEDREGPRAPPLVRIHVVQLFQKERPVRKPGQDVGLRQLQNAPVRARELACIAAREPEIGGQERGDDDFGREDSERPIVVGDQGAIGSRRSLHPPTGIADLECPRPLRRPRRDRHRTGALALGGKIRILLPGRPSGG